MSLFAASIYWDLPILLVVVSLVYSGTRHDRWDRLLVEAGGWAVRITGFLATLGGALYILSTYVEWRNYLLVVMVVVGILYSVATSFLTRKKPNPPPPPAKPNPPT